MEITTKYNIGDRVWTIDGRHAVCLTVRGVNVRKEYDGVTQSVVCVTEYKGDNIDWTEEAALFPTKEELLNSL